LDLATVLASVHKTGRLLIVDEDFAPCGVAAEIATQVMEQAFDDLDAPVRRLNGVFCPAPYSPTLMEGMVPDTRSIAEAVRALCSD
jgi:pyruvate/2-oxoglutarate/acetoin dehydrogenase E1 component